MITAQEQARAALAGYDRMIPGAKGKVTEAMADALRALLAEVDRPVPDDRTSRVVAAVTRQEPWFVENADKILERIKTDTHADVMLYHDAVSVLVAAKTAYRLVASLGEVVPDGE